MTPVLPSTLKYNSTMNNTLSKDRPLPLIGITMGDPAGIGPEIIVKGWQEFVATSACQFVVFGFESRLQAALGQLQLPLRTSLIETTEQALEAAGDTISVIEPTGSAADLSTSDIPMGRVSAAAGAAAFQFLEASIAATLAGQLDAIVTAPINKEAIRQAGHEFPGHTEILADRCRVKEFAMMLYIPEGQDVGGEIGVGVVHTTLHQSLRSALDDLTSENILSRCRLAHDFALASLRQLGIQRLPRIAVAALNPHAGENGLFGDEESAIIQPAVQQAREQGIDCTGPLPCDTLMGRAVAGEFDMVVAMYHDQGHIALKLLGMHKAVNVTLGLPIIRTSVAHGTAFEIAGTGRADATSLIRAIATAKRIAQQDHVCTDVSSI